ncbi:Rx, N-terminal, partial [Dillenia turbinata]
MSFVVESIVGSATEVLINKLISSELLNFAREEQLQIAVTKWLEQLGLIQALLTDAEEKQVTNKAVKIWLGQLRDLALDAEDILDEFQYEALRCKYMEESRASISKIRSLIPAWCTSFAPRNLAFRSNMKSKIEEITARLEQLLKQKGDVAPNVDVSRRPNKKQKRLPTTSLVEEKFGNMTKWADWSVPDTSFAKLMRLEIYECPLLVLPLSRLNSTASHLQRLALRGRSDAIITGSNIEHASLKALSIGRISGLSSLPVEFLLPNVEELRVGVCSDLERLSNGLHMLTSLKKLYIWNCAKLVHLELPLMLRILHIQDCEALRCVTQGSNSTWTLAMSGLGLQSLHIAQCPSLTSFSGNQLFKNIETLEIHNCKSLECFPSRQLSTTLKSLEINSCPKLESVSEEMLIESTSLDNLSFCRYPKLKSFPECLHTLTGLTSFRVRRCEGIETFPDTGLPTPNLLELSIECCPNLKSLPNNMHELTSLRDLRISNCPLL